MSADPDEAPRFYFALPRLIASQLGWNAERTESNWIEANVVGGLAHLIWYAFAAHVLLSGLTTGVQIALLIPLAVLVWICWLFVLYLNAVVINFLRRFHAIGDLNNARAQSVFLGILTTAFACHLVVYGSVFAFVGLIWAVAVSLNLLAAAVLVINEAVNPAE